MTARFDAIVIGASAGGVEALSVLLPALPATLQAAVAIVQHIPRRRPSLLAELFAAKCVLPVHEADDKAPVASGHVTFAPPDYHLLVDRSRVPPHRAVFTLSVDEPVHYSRPSIDVLFESAAAVHRQRLLGIVLTGANADGAAGLACIHALGGTTWVQAPETAVASMMPEAARRACPAARVLTLPEMAAALARLGPQCPAPNK